MSKLVYTLVTISIMVAACAAAAPATDNWRDAATEADEARMNQYVQAWTEGLQGASRANPHLLNSLGVLVNRSAARGRPEPAPGNFRCRTIKLGGSAGLIAYGWFSCRVSLSPGGDLSLVKVSGSQRPGGKLYPHNRRQQVFVGTLALAGERSPPRHGTSPDRDVIGMFERIGKGRYRLVMPKPAYESDLDILELVARSRFR